MCEITHSPAFLLAQERLAESEAENDQWQKKAAELWAELAALRAFRTDIEQAHQHPYPKPGCGICEALARSNHH